jgi:hypothetical protein
MVGSCFGHFLGGLFFLHFLTIHLFHLLILSFDVLFGVFVAPSCPSLKAWIVPKIRASESNH